MENYLTLHRSVCTAAANVGGDWNSPLSVGSSGDRKGSLGSRPFSLSPSQPPAGIVQGLHWMEPQNDSPLWPKKKTLKGQSLITIAHT